MDIQVSVQDVKALLDAKVMELTMSELQNVALRRRVMQLETEVAKCRQLPEEPKDS